MDVTSGVGSEVVAFVPAAIVDRLPVVVKIVEPFLSTSAITDAPVGAVLIAAVTPRIVAAKGNRNLPTPVETVSAPAREKVTSESKTLVPWSVRLGPLKSTG